jgi:hypothetical protein
MNRRDKDGPRGKQSAQTPKPANDDERLDEALKESFPASDPPAPTHPDITGWDRKDEEADEKNRRKR